MNIKEIIEKNRFVASGSVYDGEENSNTELYNKAKETKRKKGQVYKDGGDLKLVREKKSQSTRKGRIQNSELDMMADSIKEVFGGEVFMNKDFATKGLIEKWGLTARQTPSRLKKLVEMGILEDLGGSPKSYKLAS